MIWFPLFFYKADDIFVISSSDDEESAADNGTTDSNSGKSFVSTDSNAISKKKRGPRAAPYNYWHSSDECWLIEADGILRKKKKYEGRDVPVPALIRKFKKARSPIIYRGELTVSIVRRKRRHLMDKFREAVKMGDKYKPLNTRDKDLYNCSIAAWPHIIEEEASTIHDHE